MGLARGAAHRLLVSALATPKDRYESRPGTLKLMPHSFPKIASVRWTWGGLSIGAKLVPPPATSWRRHSSLQRRDSSRCSAPSLDTSVEAARKSACATNFDPTGMAESLHHVGAEWELRN